MQPHEPLNRMMLSGLAEHHRTHFSTEWLYKSVLRNRDSLIRADVLQQMLREFGLLRCLEEGGASSVLRACDTIADERVNKATILSFAERSDVRTSALDKDKKKKRSFLSGASKVLLFTHGHDFPMIDTWTKRGLQTTDKGFFRKLEDLEYLQAHRRTVELFGELESVQTWFDASRFWDKTLIQVGLTRKTVWSAWSMDSLLNSYFELHGLGSTVSVLNKLAMSDEAEKLRQHVKGPLK